MLLCGLTSITSFRGTGQRGLEYAPLVAYNVDMRTLIVGDRNWDCPRLAEKIVSRLLERYGRDLLIIHGAEPGVDKAITMACQAHGVQHEARLVARHQTGVPTTAAKNRALIMSRPNFCVAIHQTIRVSNRTRDCILQALQVGIATFLIENEWAIPVRLKPRDKRLGQAASVSSPACVPRQKIGRKTPTTRCRDTSVSGGSPSSMRAGRGILPAIVIRSTPEPVPSIMIAVNRSRRPCLVISAATHQHSFNFTKH
jgi:hypothetical protein